VTRVAQHVTVALKDSGVTRVCGLAGDSLDGRGNELPEPVTSGVARRIIE
jgi:thiamine pyrophosphate-dependent acetolactate synthase large subunit-like protein